jgi:Uma2 family endonuclease
MAEAALTFRNLDAFLAWERQQAERWEWYGGAPVAMTGAALMHNTICGNVRSLLAQVLRPRRCRAYSETAKVVAAGTLLYPDVVATCAPQVGEQDIVLDPLLIVEVLSPSSASYDRNAKRALYRLIPSLEHYLVVSQAQARVEVDSRIADGWETTYVIGGSATIALPRLGISIPMAAIYDDTEVVPDGT